MLEGWPANPGLYDNPKHSRHGACQVPAVKYPPQACCTSAGTWLSMSGAFPGRGIDVKWPALQVWAPQPKYQMAGITRHNVIRLCREHGIPVRELDFTLTQARPYA